MSTRKRKKTSKSVKNGRRLDKTEITIPSRIEIIQCLEKADKPLAFEEITNNLHVIGEDHQLAFSRRLRAMERDGQILQNRRSRYALIDKLGMVRGTIIGHADGYGFLMPDEGGEDLFLPPKEIRKVLHGDRVVGRVTGIDAKGRREGVIVEVLEHRHKSIVGRLHKEKDFYYVAPDDKRISQDIIIRSGDEHHAQPEQIVVVEITKQPTSHSQPMGVIKEVIGNHLAPGMEVELAIRKYELPNHWSEDILAEANDLPDVQKQDWQHSHKDLTHIPFVTIDGADAKDFDDAVYCFPDKKGWCLKVAIADVSNYVKPGSSLDAEAYKRGTSVYFPNRVIPMLPEAISNNLCSLRPNVDRLAMVCEMKIDQTGEIKAYQFYSAIIKSHARLTYTEVAEIVVSQDQTQRQKYNNLVEHLDNLYTLFGILHSVRKQRGSIDFELEETQIIVDKDKKIKEIVPLVRNDAHRLIEECMLAANVCAAEYLQKNKKHIPYRIHAGPTDEKLLGLRDFLFELGLQLGGGSNPSTKDFSCLLDSIRQRPDAHLIQTVMLRSMSQAIYSVENVGHFALAYKRYAHFTSPIRRYPDLMVHRAIKSVLSHSNSIAVTDLTFEEVAIRAEHCSMTSRRADEASWDVIKWLKTEFMLDKIGQQFDGLISGVTNFGIFVTLKEIYVEGLVHVTALGNDYYHFDPAHHRLTGEHTKQTYRLGDMVQIKVAHVDLDEAKIDFDLLGIKNTRKKKGKTKRAKTNKNAKRKVRSKTHSRKKSSKKAKRSANKRSKS